LEGLGSVARPHWLQKAFIKEQAAQCGYCMNGIILTAKVLLDKNPNPTDAEIKKALDNNLCRCGSHLRVIRAIKRAAQERA
jgi:nicotinate dehydrogenase subunit A